MRIIALMKIFCSRIFLDSDYVQNKNKLAIIMLIMVSGLLQVNDTFAAQLKAGVAKVNITNTESAAFIRDSTYVKALVFDNGLTRVVIIAVDLIGLPNSFLEDVRGKLQEEIKIRPENVLINVSHLHGVSECSDIVQRTVLAVKRALKLMVPVRVGVGKGYEDRIMENRRLRLKNGKEWTIRHANPLPSDQEVTGTGPVDPELGILRIDKKNGEPLAVVYNFACHPYQGVSRTGTTAGFYGFASKVIENNLNNGTIVLFLQGFGGDIIPILYKDVNSARDQEPLGNMLGLNILQTLKKIKAAESAELKIIREIIMLNTNIR